MLRDLLNISVVVFAVTSMASVGLTYTLRQIVGPLRHFRLVALALLANFVVVPAWAVFITWLLQVDEPYRVGILIVAAASGAPFLVKLVRMSDGDVAFAGSLLVLLLPVTVMYMPVVVPLIAADAHVSGLAIATELISTNILPLAAGVVVLASLPSVAIRVRPFVGQVSTLSLVALVALTVAAFAHDLIGVLGQRAILAALLLIVGAYVFGFVLGAPDHHKGEIGLATAQRNTAAAMVVATQAIGDPDTVVTVVVTLIVSMAALFPLASQLRKRSGRTAVEARSSGADVR